VQLSPENRETLLGIARRAILTVVLSPDATSPERSVAPETAGDDPLLLPAGCFVSLHETNGKLRGCTGRLRSISPLWMSVHLSALDVLEDPRFLDHRVSSVDLPNLLLEITVLSPLKEAAGTLDFDLLEEGIYLNIGKRSGCFLPQVARETGWTREQLLDRLC